MIVQGLENTLQVKDIRKQQKVSDKPLVKDEKIFINKSHKDYIPMNQFLMFNRVHKQDF